MSKTKLLNCPFCGGEADLSNSAVKKDDTWLWSIECVECGCFMDDESECHVINRWNTRKPMERILERLEEKAKEYTNDDLSYRIPWFGIEEAIEIVKEEDGIE